MMPVAFVTKQIQRVAQRQVQQHQQRSLWQSQARTITAVAPALRFPALPQQQKHHHHHHQQQRSYSLTRLNYGSMMSTGEEMMASISNGGRKTLEGNDIPLAMESLARADCVCFDVDSTVINEEGIDVLADYLGQGEAVAELTRQAMEGGMKFQDALAARLELLQPSRVSIEEMLFERPLELTPGVKELVDRLHDANKHVFLVSGGFRIMIEPVAEILQVPTFNIVANTIIFDDDDNYVGFDEDEPTSQDMGKQKALETIKERCKFETIVMVGDGATDAQAKPPADAFIGFGGVVVRDAVKAKADWFVTDFKDMTRLLNEFPNRRFTHTSA